MSDIRAEQIDAAVCEASALVSALHEGGPVTSKQAQIILRAAVRAKVPNAEDFEVQDSVKRILAEIEK